VLRVLRIGFLVVFATVTILSVLGWPGSDAAARVSAVRQWPLTLGTAATLFVIVVLVEVLTPNKRLSTLLAMFLGLLAAMLATLAIGYVVDLMVQLYDIQAPQLVFTAKVLVGIALAYICISTVLNTQDDFRLVIPYVEFAKEIRGTRAMVLDTSVLIDGRLVDLAQTGVIQSPMIIPRFVVGELQLLADSGEKLKRARGRRGLDMIAKLQRSAGMDVTVDESPIPGKAVDQQLVELARRLSGIVVTTDSGLERIAKIQGVRVINVNDIADAVRTAVVPGEPMRIEIIKPGEQEGQGVGYMDDGTMVVVEDGSAAIGRKVDLIVNSSIQTSAGRMVFGRLLESPNGGAGDRKPPAERENRDDPIHTREPPTGGDDAGEVPEQAEPQRAPQSPGAGTPRASEGPRSPRPPRPRPSRGRNPRR